MTIRPLLLLCSEEDDVAEPRTRDDDGSKTLLPSRMKACAAEELRTRHRARDDPILLFDLGIVAFDWHSYELVLASYT